MTKSGGNTNASQRDFRIDVLRAIAILGAVCIHIVYPIYSRPDFLGGGTWWLATLINTFARTSIPVFIMISGFLLLPKIESAADRGRRIFQRLLTPLVFWFGVYIWWDQAVLLKDRSISELFSMVFMSNMFNLYFLVILIGLYAVAPVCAIAIKQSQRMGWWIVAGSMLSGLVLYAAPYLITRDTTQINSLTIWVPYLGYFVLGHLLPVSQQRRWVWPSAFVIGAVLTVVLSYLNVAWRGAGIDLFWRSSGVAYFDEYLSINVIIMSLGLFGMLMHFPEWIEQMRRVALARIALMQLSRTAFGLYVIHALVLDVLEHRAGMSADNLGGGQLLSQLLTKLVLVFGISYLITVVLIRIPLVKRVFGER